MNSYKQKCFRDGNVSFRSLNTMILGPNFLFSPFFFSPFSSFYYFFPQNIGAVSPQSENWSSIYREEDTRFEMSVCVDKELDNAAVPCINM